MNNISLAEQVYELGWPAFMRYLRDAEAAKGSGITQAFLKLASIPMQIVSLGGRIREQVMVWVAELPKALFMALEAIMLKWLEKQRQ